MSTRSVIILKRKEGDYKSISCHWDGYPTYVGALLIDYYNDYDKANELTELGDLSSLKPKLSGSKDHTFESPENDVCIFYGRDRGEKGVGFKISNTINKALAYRDYEYVYKFEDGDWYVARWDDYDKDKCEFEWHLVEDVIDNEYKKYGIYRVENYYGWLSQDVIERFEKDGVVLQKRA